MIKRAGVTTGTRYTFSPLFWMMVVSCLAVVALILMPLVQMVAQPTLHDLMETIGDRDVLNAIMLSMGTSCLAGVISFVIGTPFAYLLARKNFTGKKVLESIVDLPIMIPHPVIGIAVLGIAGKNHWLGNIMQQLGIHIMGSVTGIVIVLTFVGLPFYVNTMVNGFEAIPERLENVSRSLGASFSSTFFRVTLPLAWRPMLIGFIMCTARAISEFGAVIIVAYHPMIAPVMIYERFTAYGLKYSQPVAVWLIFISLVLFVLLRILSAPRKEKP